MIYVTGDVHGLINIKKINKFINENKELTKKDYLIIAGDFGFFGLDEENIKIVSTWPFTTLFIDGNHEHHPKLRELPNKKMFNGEVGVVNESIYWLKRGQIYTIEGKTIFTFGGAKSLDKPNRKLGFNWFEEENLSEQEIQEAFLNLEARNYKVDYIITHECSIGALNWLCKRHFFEPVISPHNQFLEEVAAKTEYTKWYFGHYHKDNLIISEKAQCIFNCIEKIL